MKYYRVKFGFGKDDFYSIPETDLGRAIRAQANGTIFMCEDGTIAGNSIVAISPDYNRLLGYNRDYQLKGEDYHQIGAKRVNDHRRLLETTKQAMLGPGAAKQLTHGKN